MPAYLLSVIRPSEGDQPLHDAAMHADIDQLNDDMTAAGVRVAAYGLGKPSAERTMRLLPDGSADQVHPIGLPSPEHLDGFWIIRSADMAEAAEWGRKGAAACRAVVEVRECL
jgi:hypothetical protein